LTRSDLTFVQLSDTHIVAKGATYIGFDTARYLQDAIEAANALDPAFVVVTGDLCHTGRIAEYEHFAELFAASRAPYFVVPGNHDSVKRLREVLPPAAFGGAGREAFSYAVDVGGLRLVALDSTVPRAVNGGFDAARLDWLAATLAAAPSQATAIALHQPPFRTGMNLVDRFPYRGVKRLREIVLANPQVALVLGGHVHCVRAARWNGTLAVTAPSTSPQRVPELFERSLVGIRKERPGFIVHRRRADGYFESTVYRRDEPWGPFKPTERARNRVTAP
jgi:3',5'-cyclic AMP phosphodiesterase CpdA